MTKEGPSTNLDAERAVIACLLHDSVSIARAAACLKPADFFRKAHRTIFTAALTLHSRAEPVDLLTIVNALRDNNELVAAGGPGAIARLAEFPAVPANLEAYARLVRRAHAGRERVRIGEALMNGASSDPTLARDLLTQLDRIESDIEQVVRPAEAWAAQAINARDLLAITLPPLESFLGSGLLPTGELAFLTGHSGVGKTFLTVQLMSALSCGHTFCGLATRETRVGLVETEMPLASIQARLAALDPQRSNTSNIVIHCPNDALRLNERDSQLRLVALVKTHNLGVLFLDPFNRLHDLDENSGSDMGHVLEGLHAVRRESGAALFVLHHVRKLPSGGPATQHSRTTALDAGRGSSRLTNDPATVLALDESRGLVRLTFAKTRHCETPPTIYLKRNERGFFDVSEDPAIAKTRRQDGLTLMLERAAGEGITSAMAAKVFKVTDRTIRRDLKDIGATENAGLWTIAAQFDQQPSELGI